MSLASSSGGVSGSLFSPGPSSRLPPSGRGLEPDPYATIRASDQPRFLQPTAPGGYAPPNPAYNPYGQNPSGPGYPPNTGTYQQPTPSQQPSTSSSRLPPSGQGLEPDPYATIRASDRSRFLQPTAPGGYAPPNPAYNPSGQYPSGPGYPPNTGTYQQPTSSQQPSASAQILASSSSRTSRFTGSNVPVVSSTSSGASTASQLPYPIQATNYPPTSGPSGGQAIASSSQPGSSSADSAVSAGLSKLRGRRARGETVWASGASQTPSSSPSPAPQSSGQSKF
ncbi:hypothetical protein FRC01_014561, partial [Tulasnella sp. 417]